jgi:glycine hydroxymethyltransferase
MSDGYTLFDAQEILGKVEGPIIVDDLRHVLTDETGCLVVLALHGPKSADVLQAAGPLPGHRCDYNARHVELAVPAGQVQAVYDRLVEAGACAAGSDSPAATHALRQAAGLPDYAAYAHYGPDSGRPTGLEMHQAGHAKRFELRVPYFVGHRNLDPARSRPDLPAFEWQEPEGAPLKRTPLYDWHKAHTRKVIPFAGWDMPVWYTGVLDEHKAGRTAAGLFDVAHMGVLEVSGPHATEFLDLVLTNYARWFDPGLSFYGFLLDQDGHVIDDCIAYRRGRDRYLLVVNASNADKDWAWLNAVNDGRVLIDRERPDLRVLRPATIRNLKHASSGAEMRVDLALQGPASLAILQRLATDARLKDRLARVPKTGLIECELGMPGRTFDLVLARTGYTGEDIGYELMVHPDRALALWETLLEVGQPFGLQPCGLAARDSTRTEAGLPLYGHELDGQFDISPAGAGFAGYVKLHKPYFVGRPAYLAREKERSMEIARFRMDERGVRMPKNGDPVVNRKGRAIGWVTSAAVDVDGWILGMAYVESRYHRPGDGIGIFALPAKPVVEKEDKAGLAPGDSVQLPESATILTRFPNPDEVSHWRGAPVTGGSAFLPSDE